MKNLSSITRADWAPYLQRFARAVAVAVALLIVSAEFTYRAGQSAGRFVHNLNDILTGLASGRIDWRPMLAAVIEWAGDTLSQSAPQPASQPAPETRALMIQQPLAAASQSAPSLGLARPALDRLPVVELRRLARAAGHRTLARSGRRADLLEALA